MFSAFKKFGKLGALASSVARAWSPLALWPNGISTAGMWISPSTLPASFNDSTGTTPVATPGTVADSANPVGLALDIRAGAPDTLGPELVTNGDFSDGTTGWSGFGAVWSVSGGRAVSSVSPYVAIEQNVFTLGKRYLVSIELISGPNQVYVQVNNGGYYTTLTSVGVLSFITPIISTPNLSIITSGTVSGPASVDNISVREIPGNHMLQSTSAARPLASGRSNYINYSEDFSPAAGYWQSNNITRLSGQTDPIGGTSATRLTTLANNVYVSATTVPIVTGVTYTLSLYIKRVSGTGTVRFYTNAGGAHSPNLGITTSWARYTYTFTAATTDSYVRIIDIGTSGDSVEIWGAQINGGSTALTYQRVGAASDYTATGFPQFAKFDGTDDALASATFSAGTLTSSMDCLIAVRRDSAANCVAGLYNGISDATKFFGMAESASGSGCVGSGAGTPTVWVDNTQLTGGTAVTRGTLHTALTAGSYHILEFRNLDLSAWTATGFGLYTSYVFPGARGDIMLFESTASTADKDAARQYLADKYGVTLP